MVGIKTLFRSPTFAILTNLEDPYVPDQIHPEWCDQFIKTVTNKRVHEILRDKLLRFGKIIVCYTKIKVDHEHLLKICNFDNATIIVISSVGEHAMTPWMIIHNIGHSIFSWHPKVKLDIINILGQKASDFSVQLIQKDLVTCAASRKNMIPNINELIYELFTTWIWHGETKSNNQELAEYCNEKFPIVIEKYKNKMIHHRYRKPVKQSDMSWIKELCGHAS